MKRFQITIELPDKNTAELIKSSLADDRVLSVVEVKKSPKPQDRDYNALIADIQAAPLTYKPALAANAVVCALEANCYVEGGATRIIDVIEKRWWAVKKSQVSLGQKIQELGKTKSST